MAVEVPERGWSQVRETGENSSEPKTEWRVYWTNLFCAAILIFWRLVWWLKELFSLDTNSDVISLS